MTSQLLLTRFILGSEVSSQVCHRSSELRRVERESRSHDLALGRDVTGLRSLISEFVQERWPRKTSTTAIREKHRFLMTNTFYSLNRQV